MHAQETDPLKLTTRTERLGSESAFEVLARARALEVEGRTNVHLEIGEPDFPTPVPIADAAARALEEGHSHSVLSPGILQLRVAVADFLQRTGTMRTSPDRVIVTPGAKPIMRYLIQALCEEGDEVIDPDPSFPRRESIAR
jgi:aspartate/methionine/tyrosine aminotransferase